MTTTEESDIIEQILQDFRAAATTDFATAAASLAANGITISDLSNSTLKSMFRNVPEKRCNCCEFVGEDLVHLKEHLKEDDHFSGQEKLVIGKKKLIKRIKKRRKDEFLPEVVFSKNPDARQQLTVEEAAAFNSFASDENLTQAERTTFENLLYTSLNCIKVRSKADAPSPANRKVAVRGLTRALANAAPNADEALAGAMETLMV